MILVQEYKELLDFWSAKTVYNENDYSRKMNAGTQFELRINDNIINNFTNFFLYWQVQFDFKTGMDWSLDLSLNNCFSKNTTVSYNVNFLSNAEFNSKFIIDHIMITPYAVFIIEAKNHKKNTAYISGQDKWFIKNSDNPNGIYNPVLQIIKYQEVVSSMMAYHNINLPVIPKIVFQQAVDLSEISEYERSFCIDYWNLNKTIKQAYGYDYKLDEALKFAKTLYYYGCHPIAYDDSKENWRKSNV